MDDSTAEIGTGTDATVGPWGSDGRATLSVRAAGVQAALAAALEGLLRASGAVADQGGSRGVPIRAEAASHDRLLLELAESLRDEQATSAVAGVAIDGVLRTDAGWVAWGRALLGEGSPAASAVCLDGLPTVTAEGVLVTVTATLVRD